MIKACTNRQQAKYDENSAVRDCNVSVDATEPLKHVVKASAAATRMHHNMALGVQWARWCWSLWIIIAYLDAMANVGQRHGA
jgi:hypothetical protein